MAFNSTLNSALYLTLLLTAANLASSKRILDEQPPDTTPPPAATYPMAVPPAATTQQPSGDAATPPTATVAPPAGPPNGAVAAGAPLTFFMHDIIGGSKPSTRIVTGVVANTDAAGLPFSQPNKDIFPIQGGLPLPGGATGIINSHNAPFVVGLSGADGGIVQSNTNNANGEANNLPLVNGANLPTGTTLQNLLFGTTTVFDDEITEGHEIGSNVIGRAQGFYMASSQDGASQTLLLTAMFGGGGEYEDTIIFFGVHRTAAQECPIAIIGGTGKYENAKGYAAIQTMHPTDQHTTDGVETLLQFSVYLS